MSRAWIVAGALLVAGVGGLWVYRSSQPVDHADAGYRALLAGRNSEAVEELRLATKTEPGLASAHYNLGSAYENMGWMDQAVPELERALELEPKNDTFRRGLAQTKRTLGYRAQTEKRYADAVRLYQGVNTLVGDDATTWYNLSLVLHAVGRNDEAQKAMQRANELDPEHPHKVPEGS
jgi:tetratricopeptide (TPR) repeat protein